jgi:hypothetical protein
MSLIGQKKRNATSQSVMDISNSIELKNEGLGDVTPIFEINRNDNRLISNLATNEFTGAVDIHDASFSDNILELNTPCTIKNDLVDFGFTGKYWNSTTSAYNYAGIYRDADALGKFYLFKNYSARPHPSINHALIELADLSVGSLSATTLKNLTVPSKSGIIATLDDNALPYSWFRIGRSNISCHLTPIHDVGTSVTFDTSWNYMTYIKGVNVYEPNLDYANIKLLATGSYKINLQCVWRKFFQIVINGVPHEGDATNLSGLSFKIMKNGYDVGSYDVDIVTVKPVLDEWYGGSIQFETVVDATANDSISVDVTQSLVEGSASQITLFPIMTIQRVI